MNVACGDPWHEDTGPVKNEVCPTCKHSPASAEQEAKANLLMAVADRVTSRSMSWGKRVEKRDEKTYDNYVSLLLGKSEDLFAEIEVRYNHGWDVEIVNADEGLIRIVRRKETEEWKEMLEQAMTILIDDLHLAVLRFLSDGKRYPCHAQAIYLELEKDKLVCLYEEPHGLQQWRMTDLGRALVQVSQGKR